MADPVPSGSDVSSGTYKCTNCAYELGVTSTKNLPPGPSCGNGHWETLSGGDSKHDPYPGRKKRQRAALAARSRANRSGGTPESRAGGSTDRGRVDVPQLGV